jgi:H+-transporting ATPase
MGAVACLSSLILLWLCLDSWNTTSLFYKWHMPGLQYGQIINTMFLQVAVIDFLTLVSARTQESFFWSSNPSLVLWIGATIALLCSTLLALLWPVGTIDNIPVYGLVYQSDNYIALWTWLYNIFWFLAQDFVKVGLFWVLYRYNAFNIKGDRLVDLKRNERKAARKEGKKESAKEDHDELPHIDIPSNAAPLPAPTPTAGHH